MNVVIPDLAGWKQKTLKVYKAGSIYALPLITYVFYVATGLSYGYIDYYKFLGQKTEKMDRIGVILYASFAAWDCILIFLSCYHLALLLRSVFKLKKKINQASQHEETKTQLRINQSMTFAHIILLVCLSLTYVLTIVLQYVLNDTV